MPVPAWVPIAAEVGGSILNAIGGNSAAKKQAAEAKAAREASERMGYQGMAQSDRQFGFNANMGRSGTLDNRALEAAAVQGKLNRAPMADQAQYLLMQRLGVAPRDISRGTAAFSSSPDPRATAASYRPGMGGVDTSALQSAFARLSDESQVPGEYGSMSSTESQSDALRAQLMRRFATERDPVKREMLGKQIAELDRVLASEGAGVSGTQGAERNPFEASDQSKQEMLDRFLRMRTGVFPGGMR